MTAVSAQCVSTGFMVTDEAVMDSARGARTSHNEGDLGASSRKGP